MLETIMANDLAEIGRVADLVETFGERHGLTRAVVHDVQVCLDEILSNIVKHAFSDDAHHAIDIRIAVSGGQVVIEVADDGRPFDPVLFAEATPRGPPRRRKAGGVGIYFIKRLMDELTYRREGSLNRLVARKNLPAGGR